MENAAPRYPSVTSTRAWKGVLRPATRRAGRRSRVSERRVEIAAGGRGGIRTHERVSPLPVFKTGALNHSATLPGATEYNGAHVMSLTATGGTRNAPSAARVAATDPSTSIPRHASSTTTTP